MTGYRWRRKSDVIRAVKPWLLLLLPLVACSQGLQLPPLTEAINRPPFECTGVRLHNYQVRNGVDRGASGLPEPAGNWTEVTIKVVNKDAVTRRFNLDDQLLITSGNTVLHPDVKGMKLYGNEPDIWAGDSQEYTFPYEVPWAEHPVAVEIHCGQTDGVRVAATAS